MLPTFSRDLISCKFIRRVSVSLRVGLALDSYTYTGHWEWPECTASACGNGARGRRWLVAGLAVTKWRPRQDISPDRVVGLASVAPAVT